MDNLVVTTFDPEVAAIFTRLENWHEEHMQTLRAMVADGSTIALVSNKESEIVLEGDFLLGFHAAIHVVLGMLNPWPVTMTGSAVDRSFLYDQDVAFLHAMLEALDNDETQAVRAMITEWISELETEE